MDKKDFESLLKKYPDCVSDGKKLKAFLKDLYPDVPKAIVNTLTIMADDGIISEMQKAGQTPLVSARLQKKLEDDYGLSQKIISECFSLIIYDSAKQTKTTISVCAHEKNTSFIDTQPTFSLKKEEPQKLDVLQPEYDPKDFKIVKGVLKEYKGRSSVVVIPNSVTSIGSSAFSGCSGLTSITISDSVMSIGNNAFSGCRGLTSITISDSVTSIGNCAFRYCEKLQDIYITDIAAWCNISGLDNLMAYGSSNKKLYINNELATSITIPNGVTAIPSSAFRNCTGLTSVTIGNSVTSIGSNAFYNCTWLTSVTIGNGVTSIGDYAFDNTAWYNNQPDGLVYAGKVAYKYKGTMPWYTSIVLKEGTLGIGNNAFSGCKGLTNITIPNSVTSIGPGAFSDTAWYNNQPDGLVYAGKVAYKYKGTMPWCTSIVLKEGTLGIGQYAFYGCEELTSITIPNSVTSIGDYVFYGCTGLTSITIPNSVTSIGYRAFSGCEGLTSIIIPDSVTSIGSQAFYKCIGLTSVTIPDSVTSIGAQAFYNCIGLTSVTIPDSVTSIGAYAFRDCTRLTSVTIPDSVTSIGDEAFSSWRNLKIYCEAESKPIGWSSDWNPEHRPVVWGVKK